MTLARTGSIMLSKVHMVLALRCPRRRGRIGKQVQVLRGPATVTG